MIPIDQHPDHVPLQPIRWSAVVIAAGILLSIGATLALLGRRVRDEVHVESERPARIETTPFVRPTEAEQLRRDAARRLDSYGWVDRTRGVIHVPLDVAIDAYLGGAR